MKKDKRLPILLLLIVAISVASVVLIVRYLSYSQQGQTLECDFNLDGFVDGREKVRCGDEPPVQEIDYDGEVVYGESPDGRQYVDFELYSESTGSAAGVLVVRAYLPEVARHESGAPIVIMGSGGIDEGSVDNRLPEAGNDFAMITFMFPGGTDEWSGSSSDGVYDHRGERSILALRDVIRFAAGEAKATSGQGLADLSEVPLDQENIGLIGYSNGGNIIVAAAALYGEEFVDYLKYIIQWESPVSSQAAVRDFGRTLIKSTQIEYQNPRYCGYGDEIACSRYADLVYNPNEPDWPVFHDGNGDGVFTTVYDPSLKQAVPDLNLSGSLETDEDWPLDNFEDEAGLIYYSRAVTEALRDENVFAVWPETIATPEQATVFWDLREAVVLYDEALRLNPGLEAMVLCGARDHVQSSPTKFHVHQALEGWLEAGADWVKLNPSLEYLYQVDPRFADLGLPDVKPNTQPTDWSDFTLYAMPEKMQSSSYSLAALWQMMDRAQ